MQHSNQGIRLFIALAMAFVCFFHGGVARLAGQVATATMLGTVTDPSGAAVVGATIELTNTGTGATQTATSDSAGRYTLVQLPVGSYDVHASKEGFSNVVHHGITLTVGAQATVDFSLPIGQQAQTVTVEGEASQVEVTNSSVGTLTNERQMTELPLNGRNFEQLIQLAPGVNTLPTATSGGGGAVMSLGFIGRAPAYSIAGARPVGAELLLDDQSLENFWQRGVSTVTGSSLGIEAIGEFQTLTNTYGAQFGGNGGVINSVSKSGTNSFHGSLYEFLRNSDLDARQFIDPSQIPAFHQNQFGASLGGPIKKDKMFFFANYEGIQLVQGETKEGPVPGCNLIPSNCVITAQSPATAQAIANTLAVFPAATTIVNGQPEVVTTANRNAHENYVLGRWDYNITSKDSIFARYISDKAYYIEPYGGGGFGGGGAVPYWPEVDHEWQQFAVVEWRRLISPTLVNVAHASFSRPAEIEFTGQTAAPGIINGKDPLQFYGVATPAAGGIPQDGSVLIAGITGIGPGFQLPVNTIPNTFTEGDDLIWTHGAHNIRFGADILRIDSNTWMPYFEGSNWTFNSLSQFLAGEVGVVTYAPENAYGHRDYREIAFRPYVQDDWKVTSKLTLNLGLRWDFITNAVDVHNDLYEVPETEITTLTAPIHVSHAMASNPNWRNFDPRFGFAYDPFADHKTAIRGGFGIFHEPTSASTYTVGYWACPPWQLNAGLGFLGVTYPNIPNGLNISAPGCFPGWDYNDPSTPYTMEYNLNLQREIVAGTVMTVGYIGSRAVHQFTEQEDNPVTVCTFAEGPQCPNPTYQNGFAGGYFGYGVPGNVTANPALNPNLGSFPNFNPESNSRYNSLLVSVSKRFAQNTQLLASYTWSRCLTNGSWLGFVAANTSFEFENPYNLHADYGLCPQNISQVFKVNALAALPFHGNRFVEGWQFSGILSASTGLPQNISDGYDESTGLPGYGTPYNIDRPNYAPNNPATVINGVSYPACNNDPVLGGAAMYFNPNCYTISAPGTLGNLGKNTIIGPRFFDLDFAVLKDTRIRENMRLQFRAEFFNILNHTNYALPVAALFTGGGSTPGGNLADYTGRVGNGGQIVNMAGTPRQIQFALKLIF